MQQISKFFGLLILIGIFSLTLVGGKVEAQDEQICSYIRTEMDLIDLRTGTEYNISFPDGWAPIQNNGPVFYIDSRPILEVYNIVYQLIVSIVGDRFSVSYQIIAHYNCGEQSEWIYVTPFSGNNSITFYLDDGLNTQYGFSFVDLRINDENTMLFEATVQGVLATVYYLPQTDQIQIDLLSQDGQKLERYIFSLENPYPQLQTIYEN